MVSEGTEISVYSLVMMPSTSTGMAWRLYVSVLTDEPVYNAIVDSRNAETYGFLGHISTLLFYISSLLLYIEKAKNINTVNE